MLPLKNRQHIVLRIEAHLRGREGDNVVSMWEVTYMKYVMWWLCMRTGPPQFVSYTWLQVNLLFLIIPLIFSFAHQWLNSFSLFWRLLFWNLNVLATRKEMYETGDRYKYLWIEFRGTMKSKSNIPTVKNRLHHSVTFSIWNLLDTRLVWNVSYVQKWKIGRSGSRDLYRNPTSHLHKSLKSKNHSFLWHAFVVSTTACTSRVIQHNLKEEIKPYEKRSRRIWYEQWEEFLHAK